MQLRLVNFLIAVLVCALIAYGLWSLDGTLKNYVAAGSFLFLAGTLVPAIGLEYEHERRAINVRVVSSLFFAIGLVVNLIYSYVGTSAVLYVIGSTLGFLVFTLIANSIYAVRQ